MKKARASKREKNRMINRRNEIIIYFICRSKRPSVTKYIDYVYIYIAIGISIFIWAAAAAASIVVTTLYVYMKNTQSSSINFKCYFFSFF